MTTLRINEKGTEELIKALKATPKGFEKAATRAINKSLTSTRAHMVKMVREDLSVKAKDVRKDLVISKASWNRLYGKVIGTGSPGLPLFGFVRGSKKAPSTRRLKSGAYRPIGGVAALIYKSRGRKTISSAFIARMSSGHVGVFKRSGTTARTGKPAIKERYGPSPIKLFATDRFDNQLNKFTDQIMQKNIAHEVGRELQKIGLK